MDPSPTRLSKSRTQNTNSHNNQYHLLSLPSELLSIILSYLLTPSDPNLVIRSLFIRAYFLNVFMPSSSSTSTHTSLDITTSVLRVCKALTSLALPILYSHPLFDGSSRLDALRSQIGGHNFGLIRKLRIDGDDLEDVAGRILASVSTLNVHVGVDFGLDFWNLQILTLPGPRVHALELSGSAGGRREALRLCQAADVVLRYHPLLNGLVSVNPALRRRRTVTEAVAEMVFRQHDLLMEEENAWMGGADARDVDMGNVRVEWRFCIRGESGSRVKTGDEGRSRGEQVTEVDFFDPSTLIPLLRASLTREAGEFYKWKGRFWR